MAGGSVDQIKARLDIVDVVSEAMVLKKAGKSLKGLCPFHMEKTPSFIVFPETGTWHCFGCGEGGDMFSFVMRRQNVDFGEALKLLAARAGVELETPERAQLGDGDHIARLYAANEAACRYFHSMLAGPAGSQVRAYVEGRGVSSESTEQFQLGFAPDSGSGLAHHLLQEGYGRSEVLEAGLAGEGESGGLYDRFRGRLIFPIRDSAGKIIGFGGRALAKDAQPKYLNSPQTPLFDKGGTLYAVDRAKAEIRRTGQAVIVEGYMDALMAHQYGFTNVIAALGTAITERQLSLIKRWASELYFALDPDAAGQEATARGLSVAMGALDRAATPVPTWKGFVDYVYKLKTNIKIISLPGGRDPDEVIKADPSQWAELVKSALPVQDFFMERVRHRHDLSTAEGKAAAVEESMSVIGDIPEPVQQAHYVQRLASMVGVDETILLQQVRRQRQRRPEGQSGAAAKPTPVVGTDLESYCIALILKEPALLEREPKLEGKLFGNPAYREILRLVVEYASTTEADGNELVEWLRGQLSGPLQQLLEQLLAMESQQPVQFQGPLDKAYEAAAVNLMLGSLSLRRQQLEALSSSSDVEGETVDAADLDRMWLEIAIEAHRLDRLGSILPLRAIHKEVRNG
jgi:DNA primase